MSKKHQNQKPQLPRSVEEKPIVYDDMQPNLFLFKIMPQGYLIFHFRSRFRHSTIPHSALI